jgi:hypothetical protein
MRRIVLSSIMATGLTLALAAAVPAAPTTTTASEKQELIQARNEFATRAAQTKGAPRAEYDLERRRVDSLIDALERGQRASPEEVEDAVGDARRAPF